VKKLVLSGFFLVAHMKEVRSLSRRMLPVSLDNISKGPGSG